MSLTLSTRATIIDRFVPKSLTADITMVLAATALTALSSQLAFGAPVPYTFQTFAVLLSGFLLGANRAALSQVVYLALAAAGLPVLAQGNSLWTAPYTAGYVFGFIAAAAITGWLAQRNWDKKFFKAAIPLVAGNAVIYAFGLPWLAFALGTTFEATLGFGLAPFVIWDGVKIALVATALPGAWALVKKIKG